MKRLVVVLFSLVVYCSAAVPAHADSVPKCTPDMVIGSIPSGGCESGDLLYSNFQFNNLGASLQSSPGNLVNDILATATPFGVTFSTNYGLDGGFTNCLIPGESPDTGSTCIGGQFTMGYDVSVINGRQQIAGVGLFFGPVPTVDGLINYGGQLTEVGCLGNTADVPNSVPGPPPLSSAICANPSDFVLPPGLFPPVSNISFAMEIGETTTENRPGVPNGYINSIANVPSFTNAFLLVPVPEPPSLMLLISGLLALVAFRLKKATA